MGEGHPDSSISGLEPILSEIEVEAITRAEMERFPEQDRQGLSQTMESSDPGLMLAAVLSHVDVNELAGPDLVAVLRSFRKLSSHFEARAYEAIARVNELMVEIDEDFELAEEATALEVRAAVRLTRRAADSEVGLAFDIQTRLPRVGEALHRGSVDVLRAKILVNQTKHVPAEEAREVVNRVINSAPRLTTGQLAARIRRLCIEVKSTEAKMRYDQALKERRLVGEATNQEQGI